MISILMSVYFKENHLYLNECLNSLTTQTVKPNEVILVEDGEISQELKNTINQYRDKLLIKSIILEKNVGLASALNKGLEHCSYDLIARMDTDDIALPHRLKTQVDFMLSNPNIAVCSSYIEEKNDNMQKTLGIRILPTSHDEIVKFSRTRSPITHPVVIYRKSAILDVGGYPNIYPEDYPLWCMLISKGYRFANIPEVLLHMRAGEGMISRRGHKFLKGYIQTYVLMKKLNLIGWPILIRNIVIQSFVRLSPTFIRKLLYKYARN